VDPLARRQRAHPPDLAAVDTIAGRHHECLSEQFAHRTRAGRTGGGGPRVDECKELSGEANGDPVADWRPTSGSHGWLPRHG